MTDTPTYLEPAALTGVVGPPLLCTEDESRALASRIRTSALDIADAIEQAEQVKAWEPLGLRDLREWLQVEVGWSRSNAFRQVRYGNLIHELAAAVEPDDGSPARDSRRETPEVLRGRLSKAEVDRIPSTALSRVTKAAKKAVEAGADPVEAAVAAVKAAQPAKDSPVQPGAEPVGLTGDGNPTVALTVSTQDPDVAVTLIVALDVWQRWTAAADRARMTLLVWLTSLANTEVQRDEEQHGLGSPKRAKKAPPVTFTPPPVTSVVSTGQPVNVAPIPPGPASVSLAPSVTATSPPLQTDQRVDPKHRVSDGSLRCDKCGRPLRMIRAGVKCG